jgi:hypothetical protein
VLFSMIASNHLNWSGSMAPLGAMLPIRTNIWLRFAKLRVVLSFSITAQFQSCRSLFLSPRLQFFEPRVHFIAVAPVAGLVPIKPIQRLRRRDCRRISPGVFLVKLVLFDLRLERGQFRNFFFQCFEHGLFARAAVSNIVRAQPAEGLPRDIPGGRHFFFNFFDASQQEVETARTAE